LPAWNRGGSIAIDRQANVKEASHPAAAIPKPPDSQTQEAPPAPIQAMSNSETTPPACRVLQFTDSHLLAAPDGSFLGIRPLQTLDAVIELAAQQHPDPDLILLTGDLSQDGSVGAYQLLRQRFGTLDTPVGLIPGNHDRLERMLQVFDCPNMQTGGAIEINGWRVLLLDSTVLGKVGGEFEPTDLDELKHLLKGDPRPTLICLHHQPVEIGTIWLDSIGLKHPQPFLDVLDQYPQVHGLLWGHVHQAFDGHRQQVRLMATPSTSIQFKPMTADFALDPKPPGYRWLELHADGHITTGIERLAELPAGLDLNSDGY